MKINLKRYINEDSTIEVWHRGERAVISHDYSTNRYSIVNVEPASNNYRNIKLLADSLIDPLKDEIYPRVNNYKLSWCAIIPKDV